MCRTGDLGRYLPDGTIEYVARADQQLKIRGFRVEPGAIESVLRGHPGVEAAVVVGQEAVPGERRVVAYVVARAPAPSVGELQQRVKERLPAYMVPSAFVLLDALPLTPTGKLDRLALRQPDSGLPNRLEEAVGPRTPTEEVLADIWAEVLGIERVGIRDDFFVLGGHSLLVMQAVSRIRQALGVDVPFETVFDSPTVAELGAVVDRLAGRPGLEDAGAGPRSPTEAVVAGIWAQVLKLERVGVHADFFELGGHSLLATQLISRVRAELRVDLPLRSLFEAPTVAGLAAEIAHRQEKAESDQAMQLRELEDLSEDEAQRLLDGELREGNR
jgi:acyl carrier protein